MKKYLMLSLIFIMLGFLVSCGEKKEEPKAKPQEQEITQENTSTEEAQLQEEQIEEPEEVVAETDLGEAPVKEEKVPKAIPTNFSKEPLKCKIVALDDVVTGNFRKITKPVAKGLVEKGKILVVMDDFDRIFFVYNEDGTFASKKLAKYAANEYIGIIGKYKKINGINAIIAKMIESMD